MLSLYLSFISHDIVGVFLLSMLPKAMCSRWSEAGVREQKRFILKKMQNDWTASSKQPVLLPSTASNNGHSDSGILLDLKDHNSSAANQMSRILITFLFLFLCSFSIVSSKMFSLIIILLLLLKILLYLIIFELFIKVRFLL